MLEITNAEEQDFEEIWPIFKNICSTGDTYVFSPEVCPETAKAVWFGDKYSTHVAKLDGKIVGAYVIRPNHRGELSNHIANAAYIVDSSQRGHGIGRALGEHSLQTAKNLGYKAIQFNFVVSTNVTAINLWKSLGFQIAGTIPEGYQHQQLGKLVDIHIMHKEL